MDGWMVSSRRCNYSKNVVVGAVEIIHPILYVCVCV